MDLTIFSLKAFKIRSMSGKIKILYIDDEADNLFGFKATFRIDYQIYTAINVVLGLEELNRHPDINVIFCDQRMPGKTGVEFFEEIRISHPLPVRILLTAYTDVKSIIDAINKGNIFRFVSKPWNQFDIVSAIDESFKFYMANSMLAIKNVELQKAYDELNKFAYSVNHDIRGPLSGIIGSISLASEIEEIDEMREMLYLMGKSVKKMDAYVISMHDYYSLQRGELKITTIDFNHLIDDLNGLYSVQAKMNDVAFTIKFDQNGIFRNDDAPLKLIINNLLSNAFKYQNKTRKDKSVELMIDVHMGLATISVRDNGIGILESHQNEIFNLFYRSNSLEVGSGFGLYNVKSALLKLNGTIEVDSILHEGTTFKITIPSL